MIELLAAAAAGSAAAATFRADVRSGVHRWWPDPDRFDYAIRMLRILGVPLPEAQDRARAFLLRMSPVTNDPRADVAYVGEPPWWKLFAPRVVFSALAAALYPRRGFYALTDVAAASYVASAVALYRFLRRFGDRTSALALTAWYLRRPVVRDVAVKGLTDSTAMLLWILALDALAGLAADDEGWAQVALFTGVLSFTRPLPYLPLGGGVAMTLHAAVKRDSRAFRTGSGVTAIAFGWAAAVAAALVRAGAPSTTDHLQKVRAEQPKERNNGRYDRLVKHCGLQDEPSHSLLRWYMTAVGLATMMTLKHAAIAVVPVLAIPGLVRSRRKEVPLLLGTLAGGLLGCAVDPSPRHTLRTVVLPLYPVFAAGCMLTIAVWKRRRGSKT